MSPGALRYVAEGIDTVPGWFWKLDARLLVLIQEAQRSCGIRGDMLEVGTFMGRCAILLGYLCDVPGERLIVSDIFDGDAATEESRSWRPRGVSSPQRDEFSAHYLRFHSDLPEIICGVSRELDPEILGPHQFRLIHIDGAHDWLNVDADLRLAETLASDDAVLIFDDVGNPAYPAVAARVWSEVLSGRIHPIAVTEKLYATTNPGSPVVEALRSRIQEASDHNASSERIGETDVLVVSHINSENPSNSEDPSPSPTRSPSWKRVARELSPPFLYRGGSRLSSLIHERRRDTRRRCN